MTTSNYQELLHNLETLGLSSIREYVPNYIDVVNREKISLTEALLELTRKELENQRKKQLNRVIERARFPKKN